MVALVFGLSASFAADVYTLDDCLRIARENNATLKSAKVNRQMAEETEGSAFPAYFPKVFAGGFAFISNDFLVKQKMDLSKEMEGFGQQVAPAMMQAGIDPSMLTGLPTTFNMGMVDKGIVGHLTLIQPIFVGGQIYNGNQLAKIGTRAAKLQESLAETEIRKNTETYYWLIVSLKEKLKTLAEAEKQVDGIYSDVQVAVDAGVAVKNDLLRVELEKKKLQSNRLKLENGISVAKLMLARQMNRDNADFDLADAVEAACSVEGIARVRLGSLEPEQMTEPLVKRLAAQEKSCPQFHLSLQSGCDRTLKAMNRHYTCAIY